MTLDEGVLRLLDALDMEDAGRPPSQCGYLHTFEIRALLGVASWQMDRISNGDRNDDQG